MSGKTVVSLQIGRLYDESPPAVTICFCSLYSMERMAKYHPEFVKINKHYKELYESQNFTYFKLYENSYTNYTVENIKSNGLDMHEIFEKISILHEDLDGNQMINISLIGKIENKNHSGQWNIIFGKTFNTYSYIGEPLETIMINQYGKTLDTDKVGEYKCFTYFSHAQNEWRKFHTQLELIKIHMNQNVISRSVPLAGFYYITIHSPYFLPDFDPYSIFESHVYVETTTIKYYEQRIERLGKGYDTDCFSYDSDTNFNYYRMKSDCVNVCYHDKLRQICKVNRGLFPSKSLIRKEYLIDGNDRLISCNDIKNNAYSYTIKQDCEIICKKECNTKYYPIEIQTENILSGEVKIYHGELPDILIKHIPEITLVEFFCNFGGLLGMWLGLSIFEIINNIFDLIIKRVCEKYIKIFFRNVLKIVLNKDKCKLHKFKMFNFKANTYKTINIILIIFSFCGFFYQTHLIYEHFITGNTILSLHIGQHNEDSPPAITICTKLFSMERAGKFHPKFRYINERYQELLRNKSINSKEYKEYIHQLYKMSFSNYSDINLKNNGLDMNELFEKMSVKYKSFDESQTISFGLRKGNDNKTLPGKWKIESGKTFQYYTYTGHPFETIVKQDKEDFKAQIGLKCMTFFSHVQEEWRHFKSQIEIINININNLVLQKSFPYELYYYYIAIHSPNNLPDFHKGVTFKVIDTDKETTIKYSELRIKRLGKGWDTDCYNYKNDNNYSYYRMRSDCVNDCYQDKLRKICKVDRGLFISTSLIRKDYLRDGHNKIISCNDTIYNREAFSIKQDCFKVCKVECNENYYPIEIEDNDSIHNYSFNSINIHHSQHPDIFIEHIPELNLISFLCEFGGLLGMWLGWSIFDIVNDLFNLIYKISFKKYIMLSFSKLIHLVNQIKCLVILAFKSVNVCLIKGYRSLRIYFLSR